MSEAKIKEDKEIKQNTGAIINPASCREFISDNILRIGPSNKEVCEPVVDEE